MSINLANLTNGASQKIASMLRISVSVARRTTRSPAPLRPTNSGGSPRLTTEPYFFPLGQDHIESDGSSVENDAAADEIQTQDQECLTLSPSAPTGFSQSQAGPRRVSDVRTSECHAEHNSTNHDHSENESSDDMEQEVNPTALLGTTPHSVKTKKYYSTKYTIREKRLIVQEAFSSPKKIRKTARKYKIAHASIHHWRYILQHRLEDEERNMHIAHGYSYRNNGSSGYQDNNGVPLGYSSMAEFEKEQGKTWKKSSLSRFSFHNGRSSLIPEWAKTHLLLYFDTLRENSHSVSVSDLCHEYMTICPDETRNARYDAVRARIYRFLQSSRIVNRSTTHQAQNGIHCQETIDSWISYMRQQFHVYGFKEENVFNFDETNVNFSVEARKTLNRKGEKTINSATAASAGRATVMIGVSKDGSKLAPFVIFKAKRGARVSIECSETNASLNGYPSDMIYTVQNKAWMDEELMIEWIDTVWKPYVTSKSNDNLFLLIMDEFRAHTCASVLRKLGHLRTLVEFIPGGYTSKLQVMDVGINRPFKRIYDEEHFFFVRRASQVNAPGTKAVPSRQEVSEWISKAWQSITVETIKNTWVHVGLMDQIDSERDVLVEMENTRAQLGWEEHGIDS